MENEAPPLPGRGQHVPASEIAAFIRREEIELLLRPFLPDAGECGMVVRCLLDVPKPYSHSSLRRSRSSPAFLKGFANQAHRRKRSRQRALAAMPDS